MKMKVKIKVKMKEKTESESRKGSCVRGKIKVRNVIFVRVDLCTKTPGGKSND